MVAAVTPAVGRLLQRQAAPSVAAALTALLIFAACLGADYVFDDVGILLLDERIADPALWGRFFTESYHGGVDNLYRPLTSLTLAGQWWLHGDAAWAFHGVNWALHAGASAAVAALALRLCGRGAAWVAGLLFAAHPVHAEAVVGVVGRAELLAALFTLVALLLALRPPTRGGVLGIAACCVAALLSKEQGMLAPFLVLGIYLARPPTLDPAARARLKLLAILLCWTLAGYIAARESLLKFWWDRSLLDWSINPLARGDADRGLMPLVLLGRYVALLAAPLRLSIDYGGDVIGWRVRWGEPFVYLGAATALAWIALAAAAWRRGARATLFLLGASAVTYGLVSNAVALIGGNFGERLIYLPSAFALVLAGAALARLPRQAAAPLVGAIVIALAVRSATYAWQWRDRQTFYEAQLAQQPRSVRLHMLVAHGLAERGRLDEAAEVLRRGRDALPDYHDVWFHSGLIARQRGDLPEAERFFARAFDLQPLVKSDLALQETRQSLASTRPAQDAQPSGGAGDDDAAGQRDPGG